MAMAASITYAESYPSRPITIVVPYTAGGSVDAMARLLAHELAGRLGQPVLVENKAGAGSNIGSAFVAKAPADGYTLLLASPGNAINVSLYKNMSYDVRTQLTSVALLGYAPGILLVSPKLPVKSLQEFVSMARKSPGTINFASGGVGSSEHLAGVMFEHLAGISMVHVPYKGGAAALPDVLNGRVQAFFTNQANVIGQIKAGAVKVLAVADTKRSEILPNVPTFAEAGYPGQRVSVWWGVMAPAGTPRERINFLNREITQAVKSASMQQRITAMGARAFEPLTPEQAGQFLDAEITRWASVVKASGAKVD